MTKNINILNLITYKKIWQEKDGELKYSLSMGIWFWSFQCRKSYGLNPTPGTSHWKKVLIRRWRGFTLWWRGNQVHPLMKRESGSYYHLFMIYCSLPVPRKHFFKISRKFWRNVFDYNDSDVFKQFTNIQSHHSMVECVP